MRNAFNLSFICEILLISLSVFYYFVIFLPSNKKARQNWNKRSSFLFEYEKSRKEAKYEDCLNAAVEHAANTWKLRCESVGK
jgi:hypothetical protein